MISDFFLEPRRPIRTHRSIDRQSIEAALWKLDRSLFDGHTEFPGFSHEVRLLWISEAAHFVTRYCGMAATARSGRGHPLPDSLSSFPEGPEGPEEWPGAFCMEQNPWVSAVLGF